MSMIDTYGPSRMYLAGRGQALSELANRQQNERAATDDARQMMALQQAQARMDAEAQAQARKQAEDAQVAQMLRGRILELIPPPQVSMPAGGEKAGPFQPGMEPQATVTDRFGDIRKAAETGGLPVLQALSELVPNRVRLAAIQDQMDNLIGRKEYLDNSPEKTIVDHIAGAVRGGNLRDAEAGMRLLFQQQAKQQEAANEAAAAQQQDAAAIQALVRSRGWTPQKAADFVAQRRAGLVNQLPDLTDQTRNPRAATINERPEMVSLLRRIDDIKESIKMERESDAPSENAIRLLNQTLNGAQQEYERRYAALYGGGGGFAQTTSTTPAPGAPTQASSGDPMAAARAALGDNATIEQIEQWMEAQGL